MSDIQGWLIGLGAAFLMPFLYKWISTKGVEYLMTWQMDRVMKVLADGSSDKDWETFEVDLTLAVAKLAQAKFPQNGLGAERERMVVNLLTSRIPLLKGKEDQLSKLIKLVVERERELLQNIKAEALKRKTAEEASANQKPII